ncbi:MAG: hypothetical protein OJF50_006656 [Nitrospira sp.]|nr:hypothetical protein [Nitrospira sp.]MDI3467835.1 hypothetical protein [Nitrospira sp.]
MDDKVIVTNRSALMKKYGRQGTAKIRQAVRALSSADKKRGMKTRTVYLDDAKVMKKLGGKSVTNVADPRANKEAIDAVFTSLQRDYLMILGAPDVVPHQDLDNPIYDPADGDDDTRAWGDVPYACEAPYSRDPARFVGPTRVVGRLPDLVSGAEPSYLIMLLKAAASAQSREPDTYTGYFGLSAEKWQGSTRLSLNNIFGQASDLLLSPSAGPQYSDGELRNRMHFINCHGGPASPEFQGQRGNSYPISLTTKATEGEIVDGTVAAVECCYGAELYDAQTLGIDLPICQSYLRQGAYGYFGSTTIAYGPADSNGAADLICQYFLLNVLEGASLGRAALAARQQFVQGTAQMDPIDLKTLAQFCLLGDPSLHPVLRNTPTTVPKSMVTSQAERFFRAERRAKLQEMGAFLSKTKPTASQRVLVQKVSSTTKQALSNIAKLAGLESNQAFSAFAVKGAPAPKRGTGKGSATPSRYFVTVGTPRDGQIDNVKRGVAVVAKETNGRIVGYRIYHQR